PTPWTRPATIQHRSSPWGSCWSPEVFTGITSFFAAGGTRPHSSRHHITTIYVGRGAARAENAACRRARPRGDAHRRKKLLRKVLKRGSILESARRSLILKRVDEV